MGDDEDQVLTRFVDAFWGTDQTTFHGFDALNKRLKDGKQFCDDFLNYVKQRALIEDTYAKSLAKLAKSAGGTSEIGSLRAAWEALKFETEEVSNVHLGLSLQLQNEVEVAVKDFRDKQRDHRKKTADVVTKAQKYKLSAYEKNVKAKKLYETKCKESDKCDEEASKSQFLPPKEMEKVKAKARKAKSAAEAADAAYHETVGQLNEARVLWEREMERCCAAFQKLEEERIEYLRNQSWLLCNMLSATCVRVDERLEAVRRVLEKCDVPSDIQNFIEARMTGTERPARVEYQSYYAAQSSVTTTAPPSNSVLINSGAVTSASGSSASSVSTAAAPAPAVAQAQAQAAPASAPGSSSYASSSAAAKAASSASAPAQSASNRASYVAPGTEPPLPQRSYGADVLQSAPQNLVQAAFDYDAQGDQELSLKKGDVIKVLSKEDSTWWKGELRGRVGMFPATYVQEHK